MLVRLDERTLRAARKLVPELKEEVCAHLLCKWLLRLLPYLGLCAEKRVGASPCMAESAPDKRSRESSKLPARWYTFVGSSAQDTEKGGTGS